MNKTTTLVIVVLLFVIAILSWLLVVKPAEAPTVPLGNGEVSPTPPSGSPTPPPTGGTTPTPLHDRVSVTSPKANAAVSKTFTVTGKAPGNWFFEASAPIMVSDPNGNKLGQSYIQAQGDWMTTELVNYEGTITLSGSYKGPATLILMKDNPSGLPEHDDSLEIPITIQ